MEMRGSKATGITINGLYPTVQSLRAHAVNKRSNRPRQTIQLLRIKGVVCLFFSGIRMSNKLLNGRYRSTATGNRLVEMVAETQ